MKAIFVSKTHKKGLVRERHRVLVDYVIQALGEGAVSGRLQWLGLTFNVLATISLITCSVCELTSCQVANKLSALAYQIFDLLYLMKWYSGSLFIIQDMQIIQ